MGHGDMGCNNAASRIPTPSLDELAGKGMRFTDAHAASSLCTPSRYSILTGRYCWRSRLRSGIVWPWDASLIEETRPTVAGFLRERGYRTACFGKWHLGWDWPTLGGVAPNDEIPFAQMGPVQQAARHAFNERIDYASRIGGGPVDRGFDHYFGVDVPNFPPYAWFEDDRLTQTPTVEKPATMYGDPGRMVPGWSLEAMVPEFTRRAIEWIERCATNAEPFFVYLPLTSPHSPIVPNDAFLGRSGCGRYGDFVCEVDGVVGQVVEALERTGVRDETLVVFTSDNGPEDRTADDEGVYARARRSGHYSMGERRGIKRDAWEGGHRVPFVASWPGVVPEGSRCDQAVCLSDLFATCAELIDAPLGEGAAEDSVSMLPLLRGATDRPTRRSVVHQSGSGKLALRRGRWVCIDAASGGDVTEPDWFRVERGYGAHDQPAELFDLTDDPGQRCNRYADHPELAAEMLAELKGITAEARIGLESVRPTGGDESVSE